MTDPKKTAQNDTYDEAAAPSATVTYNCDGCGRELVTHEYEVTHIHAVEKRITNLECAVARYQDELWEQGKL